MGMSVNHYIDTRFNTLSSNNFDPKLSVVNYWSHQTQVINPSNCCHGRCTVVPPKLTDAISEYIKLLDKQDLKELDAAHKIQDKQFREKRKDLPLLFVDEPLVSEKERKKLMKSSVPTLIRIYDAGNSEELPGKLVTSNLKVNKKADEIAKAAFADLSEAFDFYYEVYKRNSIDGHGMTIDGVVHFGVNYPNAFWDEKYIVLGDGNKFFRPFALYGDATKHEYAHAVLGRLLDYFGEAGALNESLADVFGAIAEQYSLKQTADKAKWLMGYQAKLGGILVDPINKKNYPIRSLENPGSAYHSPVFGNDPQPAHYAERYIGEEDDGGVHINSGIPNRAFCLAAKEVGGYAWEKVGKVWYSTIHSTRLVRSNASMADFTNATVVVAKRRFKEEPKVSEAIVKGWRDVGVIR